MAVCKQCGSAIPLGKHCEICGPVAPAPVKPTWQPPDAIAPVELASTSSSWHSTTPPAHWKTPASEKTEAEGNVTWASAMVALLAACCVGVGLYAELAHSEKLRVSFGWPTVGVGAMYLVLAFFVGRRSLIALGLAAGMCALGILLMGRALKSTPGLLALVELLQVTVFGVLFRAFPAMTQLVRQRKTPAPDRARAA